MDEGFLLIGKIIGVHGVKGNLKAYSYAESISVFTPGESIFLKTVDGKKNRYVVRQAKPHSRTVLLSLKEIRDRDQAEELIGSRIFINKKNLNKPAAGDYYQFDIIGLSVATADGDDLGCIESILETGSNDVYIVRNKDREILIPALESVVLAIDLEKKIMTVDLPEGL